MKSVGVFITNIRACSESIYNIRRQKLTNSTFGCKSNTDFDYEGVQIMDFKEPDFNIKTEKH